jgi:hypothetical protein
MLTNMGYKVLTHPHISNLFHKKTTWITWCVFMLHKNFCAQTVQSDRTKTVTVNCNVLMISLSLLVAALRNMISILYKGLI